MNTPEETLVYAEYVLKNIKRAKAGNVLKISDKVLERNEAMEFVNAMYKVIDKSDIEKDKLFRVLRVVLEAGNALMEGHSYNRQMIIDKMVIGIWSILHEEEKK